MASDLRSNYLITDTSHIHYLSSGMVKNTEDILKIVLDIFKKMCIFDLSNTNNPGLIDLFRECLNETSKLSIIIKTSMHLFRSDYSIRMTHTLINHYLNVSPIIRQLLDVFIMIDKYMKQIDNPDIQHHFIITLRNTISIIRCIKEPFMIFALSLSNSLQNLFGIDSDDLTAHVFPSKRQCL